MKAKFYNDPYLAIAFVTTKNEMEFRFRIFAHKRISGVKSITTTQSKNRKKYHKDFRELIFLDDKNIASSDWGE